MGRMRNEWFPRRIAEYVPQAEVRTLRLNNTTMERDVEFGISDLAAQISKSAADKQKLKSQRESKPKKVKSPSSRRWVPPTFITVGLLGVAWLIVFYVAGPSIPLMSELGNWNILIGMGGMAAAFGIATLWK